MRSQRWWNRRAPLVAVLVLTISAVGSGVAPPAARGDDPPVCPRLSAAAYTMTVGALTGQQVTDLTVGFTAAPGCEAVTVVKQLQIVAIQGHGRLPSVRILRNVPAQEGVVSVVLGRVERGLPIAVHALLQAEAPRRAYVLWGTTKALLRPDLVVASVSAPLQTLTTRPIDVVAEIAEINGDTAATAHIALADAIGPLAGPIEVKVPAGGRVSVTFPAVALTTATSRQLKVVVTDAAPAEYDVTNGEGSTTVEVTSNELVPLHLLVPSLGGYGFQMNGHLYAPITNPDPATLPGLESKVKALEPQLVRVFYNDNWEANADGTHAADWAQNLESFKNVVKLANDSGASIVIAYQTVANAKKDPTLWMGRFADVLQDLVQERGLTNVRWALIGNEPNTAAATVFSKEQYKDLYTKLHAALAARGLHDQVGLIGGDLVQNTEGTAGGHRAWFDYMVTNMNDVVDAWSEHIYWNYWDHFRMEERLKDVAHLVRTELPEAARKPTFILEYGVRGMNACGTETTVTGAYYNDPPACTELRRMSLAGFHKVWFTVASAQLGFDGAANWDLYWSVYDRTKNNQSYWTIGPPEEGWALYPTYYAFQLLLQTTARGWQVLAVDPWTLDDQATRYDDPHPDQLEQELTAYRGTGRPADDCGPGHAGKCARRAERRVLVVQHRRLAAVHDVHARALERDRGRHELRRRDDHHERRRRGTLRRAAPGSIRADDRSRLVISPAPGSRLARLPGAE